MAVTDDRKFSKESLYALLESVKGKTLGEVDSSHQFDRTVQSPKITGIAGDVVEQSVFGMQRDSRQECDIEIDGVLTELKTTGVRIPKSDLAKAEGKTGAGRNKYLGAKEGISITDVTFEPIIQTDFATSHFWKKSERMLMVFYEYLSYDVVPASAYANFPIVDYCLNTFSESEQTQLRNDWELVRDYLQSVYSTYDDVSERNAQLEGFTHILRPQLLLIELVPSFKKRGSGSYQKPRYRLKKTFVDYIVRGHFNKSRAAVEMSLAESFSGFAQLDARCHLLALRYGGMTFVQLKEALGLEIGIGVKDFAAKCVLRMFDAQCKKLNQISDFSKAGIIAKTITVTPKGCRTEDMKMNHIDFGEWANRNTNFEDSEVYGYFCEHSFLCPIFCEHDKADTSKTTFEGFKRFAFDDDFIENEVRRTWEDSRNLIFSNNLKWKDKTDSHGKRIRNNSGGYVGSPNFPKSSKYMVFFRGGARNSTEETRTECVNGIKMLPQFFWLKGSFIAGKLREIPYL